MEPALEGWEVLEVCSWEDGGESRDEGPFSEMRDARIFQGLEGLVGVEIGLGAEFGPRLLLLDGAARLESDESNPWVSVKQAL